MGPLLGAVAERGSECYLGVGPLLGAVAERGSECYLGVGPLLGAVAERGSECYLGAGPLLGAVAYRGIEARARDVSPQTPRQVTTRCSTKFLLMTCTRGCESKQTEGRCLRSGALNT
jgi:hypothetical protein